MTAQAITARMLADAKVKALTVCHDRHAAEMRGMCMTTPDAAVTTVIGVARTLAQAHAPKHDTGVYALSDTTHLYARRLLLQATAAMFAGSTEGDVLTALDGWLSIAGRQCHYEARDSTDLHGIKAEMIEAVDTITEAIGALCDQIDGA